MENESLDTAAGDVTPPGGQPWSLLQQQLWLGSYINRIGKIKAPSGPIYHYTSAKVFENIITTGTIRLSNAAYLNDQGELTYPARVARAVLREALESESDEALRFFFAEAARTLDSHALFKSWYVASFSLKGNLLSQWRAYCPSGGYSIGLNGDRTARVVQTAGGRQFGPVLYKLDEQIAVIRGQVKHHIELWRDLRVNHANVTQEEYDREVARTLGLALSEEFVFFKAEPFEEEHEWRLVKYRFPADPINFYDRHGVLTPHLNFCLFESDGKLPLEQLFVSPLGDQELATHSAELVLTTKNYPQPWNIINVPSYRLRF